MDSKNSQQIEKNVIKVTLLSGKEILTNMVIMGIGVLPENKLAKESGLELGERGGIKSKFQNANIRSEYLCCRRCQSK